MKAKQLVELIASGGLDTKIINDCAGNVLASRKKYIAAIDSFTRLYGDGRELHIYSVGGRTEVSGNHTDHNCGCVLAAAVNLELVAVAAARDDGVIRIKSEGFPEDVVPREAAAAPDESKFFTSYSIIAGMENAFTENGFATGGFDAYTTSEVLKGSGISSSAAFEVMVGNILNHMYNGARIENAHIARMAQCAENIFFGKPCGLMDQTACAVGGFISIDFADPSAPVIKKCSFDLAAHGYALCIVNTGGNHADLNEDYASVPAEMKAVAALLGKKVLRECTEDEIIRRAPEIRAVEGDRALLRALHFTAENSRVVRQADALGSGDLDTFLRLVTESGDSSYKYLQNVFTTKNVREQGLSLALCLTQRYFKDKKAAWRVHGGGFAGTVQVFLPESDAAAYKEYIEAVFGAGACRTLSVRRAGAVCLA